MPSRRQPQTSADAEIRGSATELRLDPLPCWAESPKAKIRKYVAEMVAEIEAAAALRRKELDIEPLGMGAIRNQNPFDRPNRSKKTPKPLSHVASVEMRDRVKQAYRGFVEMFRHASAKVKFGDVAGAVFPKGSFPPSLPFMRSGDEFDPLADAGGWPASRSGHPRPAERAVLIRRVDRWGAIYSWTEPLLGEVRLLFQNFV